VTIGGQEIAPVYINMDYSSSSAVTVITSVGLTMPSAFTVTNSPLTTSGTINVTGAGTTLQYVRGDGSLATFPTITNGTVTSVNLTAGTGISVSGGPITTSGSINVVNTAPDQVVSLTGSGTTTITGTYPNFTITSNDSRVGTVTSVDMTVPTGLTISGNPITSAGTLALALASGYSIPTTANQANWTTAYNDSITSASVSGTSTKTLTLNQQDGGTIQASWSDLNTDAVTSVFSRTGAVVASGGDYTTAQVTESGNLYYTELRVSANADVAANTAARHNAVTIGTANGLSLSTQSLSLGLASSSANGALSSTDWSTFNSKQVALNGTGFVVASGTTITYDNNTYYLASNPNAYIPLTALSAGTGITYNNTTGVITNAAPDQVVSLTAGSGVSISGTYPSFTIASTITQYTDALARLAISESVTGLDYDNTTGVFSLTSGYVIPTTTSATNWDAAYNDKINSAAVTGTTTKTLTLNQQDGGTITASWTDDNTDAVTSVFGRTGVVTAQSGDYTTTQVTEGTNLYYTDARARAAITLTTTGTSGVSTYIGGTLNIPNYGSALSAYVPYTGATTNVNLGTHTIIAQNASIASTGSGNTATITHSSGSGIALNITKGGNGEGLYIDKTSGAGNAATIIGTLNATTLVKSGGTSTQFLKADGSVDSTTYQAALTLTTTGSSGSATLVGATLNIPSYSVAGLGAVPDSRTITINGVVFDLSANRNFEIGDYGSF
jgi:hypothetical protein